MPMIRKITDLGPLHVLTRTSHQSSLSLSLSLWIFVHPSLVFLSVPKSAAPSFERFWFHISGSMCNLLHGSGNLGQGDDAEHDIRSIVLPFAPTRRDLFFACSLASPPICHPTSVPACGLWLSASRTPLQFRQQGAREREYATASAPSSSVVVVPRPVRAPRAARAPHLT